MTDRKRYRVIKPVSTHYVKATCEEVECEFWLDGWVTGVEEYTPLGERQATYIRANRKGQYTESKGAYVEGFWRPEATAFKFKPETTCFNASNHARRLEREPFYLVKEGGHQRRHDNAVEWVEDFAEHQNKLSNAAR